eukprot:CAMPEP_0173371776 /NCGR_PEP_ID=MMETSP1144-20121109/27483_1 /TAXON_ID=483371 /ORGANISM="non described non described, Strain CCMP2298" /LENGTH=127 /DNA_ID=CAMNT_0014323583 /DNA_START=732 /DNA_END=1116 /DNA_ORIENTATION=+
MCGGGQGGEGVHASGHIHKDLLRGDWKPQLRGQQYGNVEACAVGGQGGEGVHASGHIHKDLLRGDWKPQLRGQQYGNVEACAVGGQGGEGVHASGTEALDAVRGLERVRGLHRRVVADGPHNSASVG